MAKKSPLGREKILGSALQLIEREGLAAFSMRRLAEQLKIEPMSLYYYFPNKLELLNALLDQVLGEFRFLATTQAWDKQLRHAAQQWRSLAIKYPNFYQFMAIHRMDTPGALQFVDSMLEILKAAQLSAQEAALQFRALGFFLMGAAMDETAGHAQAPGATTFLSPEEQAQKFPHLQKSAEFFAEDYREKSFKLGLDLFIANMGGRT